MHVSDVYFFLIWAGVGTVAFDARLGLYEDPPPEEALTFIKEVQNFFALTDKLLFSAPSRFARQYIDTPTLKKFHKCSDTILEIGLGFVEKKMKEIKEMTEKETDSSANDQGMFLTVCGKFHVNTIINNNCIKLNYTVLVLCNRSTLTDTR